MSIELFYFLGFISYLNNALKFVDNILTMMELNIGTGCGNQGICLISWQTSSAVDGITGISTFNYQVQIVLTENILLNAEQDKISDPV